MSKRVGVGVTTYNSERYFQELYDTIPRNLIDELVIVNGGAPYQRRYDKTHWIQHEVNKYPSVCRNECVEYLQNQGCQHIFIIEDDMLIKNSNIFERYIEAHNKTGLGYFSFVSTSPGAGVPGKRTPRVVVEYPDNCKIALYNNMCNEFTYHHNTAFKKTGVYDGNMREAFDVELAYRESMQNYSSLFWWFADIIDSDEYICNNPTAVSRLQSDRPDGSRAQVIDKIWEYFYSKHNIRVNDIPQTTESQLRERLMTAYNRV